MAKVMSEKMKMQLADDLGFGDKIENGSWSNVTSGEIGNMVREAIKRGEEAMEKEDAVKNGVAHQHVE